MKDRIAGQLLLLRASSMPEERVQPAESNAGFGEPIQQDQEGDDCGHKTEDHVHANLLPIPVTS